MKKRIPEKTGWCFAKINGKLGEIYFATGKGTKGIYAHCYVDRDEFSKKEQEMIDADIQKHRFTYRSKLYTLQAETYLSS